MAAELNGNELSDLLGRIAALKSVGGDKPTKKEQDGSSGMYLAVAEAITAANGTRSMPMAIFRKTRHYSSFAQSARLADEFVNTLERDRVKKIAVRRWLCKLMIASMIEKGRPLEWFALSAELAELPALVNEYFPGYMSSGLMSVVLDSLYKGGRKAKAKLKKPKTRGIHVRKAFR